MLVEHTPQADETVSNFKFLHFSFFLSFILDRTGGADGKINIWDSSSCQFIMSYDAEHPVLSLCRCPTSVWFGSRGLVGCVNFNTQQITTHAHSEKGKIWQILYVEESGEVWAFSSLGTIFSWSTKTGNLSKTILRHRDKIVAATYTNGLVWSCSADSVMICWKARTYETLRTLRGVLSAVVVDAVCAGQSPACIWTSTKNNKICIYKKD
tara:strand:- start:167 stop:796 length:630 start_codon:yes stop_codon:yes gene_type:complete